MVHNYHTITEVPGLRASREQVARICHRYRFAREFAAGRDVLEVACGSGLGLGYLARSARSVTGGDIDRRNVEVARGLYAGSAVAVRELDAHALPFAAASFDLLLLFEAIYYLHDPDTFVREAARVLRPGGTLIVCTVNRAWGDFHPSPYTHRYFDGAELRQLLSAAFDDVRLAGAFPAGGGGAAATLVSWLKRMAVRFDLIPGSLAARAYLKRLFMGPLAPLPAQIDADGHPYDPPVPLAEGDAPGAFKILYATARKGGDA